MNMRKAFPGLLLLPLLAWLPPPATASELVMVVNAANTSVLGEEDIKRIMLARTTRYANGTATAVILRSNSFADWAACTERFMGKSPEEVQRIWATRVFSGAVTAPRVLGSEAEAAQGVAANPGGIACVTAATAAGNSGLRIVAR